MELKNAVAPTPVEHKRSPVLFIFALLLLAFTVAGTFYLSLQKTAILGEQQTLDKEIADLNTQVADLKGQKVEAEQFAKKYLDDLQKNEIHWSEVIKSVNALVPLDSATQKPKVRFLYYSGAPGGKLSLNVETLPAPQPAFADVSELLNVFNHSTFFHDAYIPSINRGVSETGNILLSFTFNLTYSEQSPEIVPSLTESKPVSETQPSVKAGSSEQVVSPAKTKVPRK